LADEETIADIDNRLGQAESKIKTLIVRFNELQRHLKRPEYLRIPEEE